MIVNVINTGGTISCTGDPLSPMSASTFASACQSLLNPVLAQQFPSLTINYVTDLSFPESSNGSLDSTNLQPTDWCLIAQYILDHYTDCDGWVVLHGTDSMDFTGTALGFLMSGFTKDGYPTAALSKPVIITGSQVPMFYEVPVPAPPAPPPDPAFLLNFNTDAFQNFCGAVACAQSGVPEVCIYFDAQLYRGNRSIKSNASEFNAFSSPNYPALGEYGISLRIDHDNVLPPPVGKDQSLDSADALTNVQNQLTYIAANINSFPVMQFNAFPAAYPSSSYPKAPTVIASLINACVGTGIKGLILESYGEGNFPSGNPDNPSQGATYQALAAANKNGVVIVDCTQVIQGVVNDNAYAAGAWLPNVGALNPADMTPMAALAKLIILLAAAGATGNGWTAADVKRLMQLNLLGEMMSVSRLDSRVNSTLMPSQALTALDGSATLTNDPVNGPVLVDNKGKTLWQAFSTAPQADHMPGQLIMQNDGNLVYYSRYNSAMWATDTGLPDGASSMLVLGGSTSDGSLSLTVYDYSRGNTTSTLYSQA